MRSLRQAQGRLERAVAQCPQCRGLGWVKPDVADPTDSRFGRLIPCPRCGDTIRELRELRVMELLQEHIARYTAFQGSLQGCTFESFDTASDQRVVTAYNAVIRFVRGEVPWVYLYGPPGNGKTHLAAAAVNRLVAEGGAVLFTTAPELLAMIREGFDAGRAENLIGLCQRVPWLCDLLDAHGVEVRIFGSHGHVQELIPVVLEAGINTLWVGNTGPAGLDYVALRREYGRDLRLIGGIDVRVLEADRAAVEAEVKRVVPPLMEQGGYVPMVDGRVRKYVPYENYRAYRESIRELAEHVFA